VFRHNRATRDLWSGPLSGRLIQDSSFFSAFKWNFPYTWNFVFGKIKKLAIG
jgi:hypothetical protein